MSDVSEVIDRASALTEIGRAAEAIAILQTELAGNPDDPDLLDALAVAQLDVSAPDALETAGKLIALDPDGYRGHYLAALACMNLNRVKEAVAHAEAAVTAVPYLADAQAAYAESVSRQPGKRDQALEAAHRAIGLAPGDPVGYVAAGNVELHYGNWRRAEKRYLAALEIDPTDHAASLNLALVRDARGSVAPAFADARNLLSLDPQDDGARGVLDEIAYTTLVHLAWVVLALLWGAAALRGLAG